MNEKLIEDIQRRVREVNAQRADESELSAHLDALAEVHDIDRRTIESIARDVIAERSDKASGLDFIKLRNVLWIGTLVIIIISVIWLLYNNLQNEAEPAGLSKDHERKISYVKEVLASLNVVKVYFAENVATTGQVPSSFQEIGVMENELITKYISRIQLQDGGVVIATFSELIDEQQYIRLIPILRTSTYTLDWDCRSNLEQNILDEIKGCTPD